MIACFAYVGLFLLKVFTTIINIDKIPISTTYKDGIMKATVETTKQTDTAHTIVVEDCSITQDGREWIASKDGFKAVGKTPMAALLRIQVLILEDETVGENAMTKPIQDQANAVDSPVFLYSEEGQNEETYYRFFIGGKVFIILVNDGFSILLNEEKEQISDNPELHEQLNDEVRLMGCYVFAV